MSITKICKFCKKDFIIEPGSDRRNKLCGKECLNLYYKHRQDTGVFVDIGRKGGLKSVKSQERRSKNEIHFANMCIEKFGDENVLCNEPMFDGWDADIIIPKFNIAISWNGIWHYKQVKAGHSLQQVQSRDKIKNSIIKAKGYTHIVIVDMGSEKIALVKSEFDKLLKYLYFI